MSDSDSEVFALTRKCSYCKNYKDTRQIRQCDYCLKSLCNQCLDLVKLKIDDENYMQWLNLLTYNELKLWEINNPKYEKSFCLACDNM
jgi:hypothetical protein